MCYVCICPCYVLIKPQTMRNILLLLIILCSVTVSAQQFRRDKIALIEYSSLDKSSENYSKTFLYYKDGVAKVYHETEGVELSPLVAKEFSFVNYTDSICTVKAQLKDNKNIHYSFPIKNLYNFNLTDEYTDILGYKCRKATKVSFSNKIEVWYTTEAKVKGSPIPGYGLTEGLIMKISRNGNVVLCASAIKFLNKRKAKDIEYGDLGEKVNPKEEILNHI